MKKRTLRQMLNIFFAATLIFIMGAAAVHGAGYSLQLDGKTINTPVPPAWESGRILVPARAAFTAMGAAVTWTADNPSKVIVDYNGTKIDLTINSNIAYVNGTAHTLDVPARLVNNSTMIPVRFVSEAMGFGVSYDADKQIVLLTSPKIVATPSPGAVAGNIQKVQYDMLGEGYRIAITADSEISSYSKSNMTNPNRFLVDIKGFKMGEGVKDLNAESSNPLFSAIRTGQFAEDTVRVVLDLKQDVTVGITLSNDKKTLYIDCSDSGDPSVIPPTQNDPTQSDPTQPGTPADPTTPVNKKPASLADVLIVIDAGHGGRDPGSQGKTNGTVVLNEKDINLNVATRVNQKLQAAGFNTIMTRTGDTSCSPTSKNASEDLAPRANLANEKNATLFVSIHNNSLATAPTARGTETLYNETDGKSQYGISSKDLATLIQKKMIGYIGTYNRGPKSRPDLYVLRKTDMPAVLVEGAFLSNASDLALMQTDAFAEKYAQAVADGIVEYLNSIYK